jgi:hypothetical protein
MRSPMHFVLDRCKELLGHFGFGCVVNTGSVGVFPNIQADTNLQKGLTVMIRRAGVIAMDSN